MCVMIITFALVSTTVSSPVLVQMLTDAEGYLVGGDDVSSRLDAQRKLTKLLASPGTLRHHRWSKRLALPHRSGLHPCAHFAPLPRFGGPK